VKSVTLFTSLVNIILVNYIEKFGALSRVLNFVLKVNPQAVNEPGFDVFTANTRSVLYMKHSRTGLPVVFVAIGALLVGSIKWTNGGQKGNMVKRGEELG
jgi:phosphatidylserine decarboxylase